MTSRKARGVSNKKIDVIRESLKIIFRNDECKKKALDCVSDVIADDINDKMEQNTGLVRFVQKLSERFKNLISILVL